MRLKIGVVTSRFNQEITQKLKKGAVSFLENNKSHEIQIVAIDVPGAIEIPLIAKVLLYNGCDGVVVCGAVIRGDTSHYDLVCNSVERGVSQLILETTKPIGFGVITTEDEEQAHDRAGGKEGNKGQEAAAVCIEMLEIKHQLMTVV